MANNTVRPPEGLASFMEGDWTTPGTNDKQNGKQLFGNSLDVSFEQYPNSDLPTIHGEEVEIRLPPQKFGTWDGVFVTCLLSILGLIVFVRTGWIVGNAGIGLASVIILISSTITVTTTLSMSAICTNREMLEGGAYYLISRSLGPRVGGSAGILYVIGQAVTASLYCIGFAETFADMVGWGGNGWAIRGVALIVCLLMFGIAMIGVKWVIKFQLLLLLFLIIPFITLFIGSFIPRESISSFYTGYKIGTFTNNWGPQFEPNENFFKVFGIFFPAVTGILAGASMSGNLKNPAKSVPVGTLSAIGISSFLYLGVAWLLGSVVIRSTLQSDFYIFPKISVVSPLVLVGIYIASLSSVLSALVGAPRVLQSIATDGVIPILKFFAKINKRTNEPIRAYLVIVLIAMGFIFIGTLNAIAPLTTMFSLLTYAMLNYACFASASGETRIGWNPTFKFYNRWLSLFMWLVCFVLMFLVEWISALIAIALAIFMYVYIAHVDADVSFGFANFNILTYLRSRFLWLRSKFSKRKQGDDGFPGEFESRDLQMQEVENEAYFVEQINSMNYEMPSGDRLYQDGNAQDARGNHDSHLGKVNKAYKKKGIEDEEGYELQNPMHSADITGGVAGMISQHLPYNAEYGSDENIMTDTSLDITDVTMRGSASQI